MKTLNTTKKRVEEILAEYPQCRDSDKRLWLTYLTLHHNLRTDMIQKPQLAFETLVMTIMDKDTPSFDTLGRCRRKLQAEGLYPASDDIKKARKSIENDTAIWAIS